MKIDDVEAMKLITAYVINFKLIHDLNRIIEDGSDPYIEKFYLNWCKKNNLPSDLPLNPGTMWTFSMVVLQSAEEQWWHILPVTPISELGEEWGLKAAVIKPQKYQDLPLKDLIENMRHALAHFNVIMNNIEDPNKPSSFAELMQQSTFTLLNVYKAKRFQITINYRDLSAFITQVCNFISNHVLSQIDSVDEES